MYGRLSLVMVCGLLAFWLSQTSCREKPPLKLTTRQWARVDTIFTDQLPALRQELDSLCELNYDARLQEAVDSILAVRRREEAELRKRIPRKK